MKNAPWAQTRSAARWLLALGWCGMFLAVFATTALAEEEEQELIKGTSSVGRRLFYSAALSTNGLSCTHCHADFDEERENDGLIRAGHSLYGAASRPNWWGKDPDKDAAYPNISAAAVVCVEHYLRNSNRLTSQQQVDLRAYLKHINRRPTRQALVILSGADKTGQYLGFEGGDKILGRQMFYAACHLCHPNGNAGIGPALPRDREASFYAKKVREGDGIGAVFAGIDPNAYDPALGQFMPFFAADRLSNDEVRDIIAYIKSLPPLVPPTPEVAKNNASAAKKKAR